MPSPRAYTSVLAVPRSIARSRQGRLPNCCVVETHDTARLRVGRDRRPERGPEAAPGSPTDRTTATRPQPQQHGTERCGENGKTRKTTASLRLSLRCNVGDVLGFEAPRLAADQRSRFQIGTVDLRVSIPNRAASKAAAGGGRRTTMMTIRRCQPGRSGESAPRARRSGQAPHLGSNVGETRNDVLLVGLVVEQLDALTAGAWSQSCH